MSSLSSVFTLALGLVALLPSPSLLAQRLPTEGRKGLVASAEQQASQAGLEILKKGGNAVDAAIATGFCLAVTYPRAGNLGGGGFLLLHLADGRSAALNFRETAPALASRDMYLDAQGQVIDGLSVKGHKASGVPGTVAGFALAYERYGSHKVSWAELIEPARRLAAGGLQVSPALARDLRASESLLGANAESKHIFLHDGKLPQAGDTLVQADLADTLARLAKDGPSDFYAGETARRLVADQVAHGGLIRADDLAHYRAQELPVLQGSYRGYTLLTMPPPSSGGIALLQILAFIEPFNVESLGHNSAAKIHLFTEAMRRAFQDRARFLGDPDFVKVPVAGLLQPDYLKSRFADFNPDKATPSAEVPLGHPVGGESTETTHYSVVDADGNAVAVTYTLNGLYGSGVTAAGTGILLNNEMDDFTTKLGAANHYGLRQGPANLIAPGKRPLSSMTPTIVLKDGKLLLVTGSPGGPTIITTVLQVLTNVVDHHMSITQAVDAPRFHHQWQPDQIAVEPFLTSQDSRRLLEARGHTLTSRKLYPNDPEAAARSWGDAESILVDPRTGLLEGANDLRSPDSGVAAW